MTGKVALVTGASRGIGKEIAFALAGEGFDMAITHLNEPDSAEEAASLIRERFGVRCLVIQADLADSGAPGRCMARVLDELGRIDALVNNAAEFLFGSITEVDMRKVRRLMEVNFTGGLALVQEAAKSMIGRGAAGSIVNVTSSRSQRAYPSDAVYGGMKAAMARASEAMALDLAPHGIRVNCVAPGAIATERTGEEWKEKLGRKIPLGRMGMPSDVANAVVWLCSDKASYVTGITLRIDGGLILPGMPEDISPEAGYGWGRTI